MQRTMVALAGAAGVAAGLGITTPASRALAQSTRIINEASIDGGVTWSSSVHAAPGSRVDVRVRVALEGATALGLAGITFQPTLSNWQASAGDAHVPFTFPGLSNNILDGTFGQPVSQPEYMGSHVADEPGRTGRIFPFGSAGQFHYSASGIPTSFNDPGGTLRFAGARNTTPTTTPGWGISISQYPPSISGTNFATTLDAVVFKYAVTLSSNSSFRTLTASVPWENIRPETRSPPWYTAPTGHEYLRVPVTPGSILGATITVPTAPAWALAACALALGGARRRR